MKCSRRIKENSSCRDCVMTIENYFALHLGALCPPFNGLILRLNLTFFPGVISGLSRYRQRAHFDHPGNAACDVRVFSSPACSSFSFLFLFYSTRFGGDRRPKLRLRDPLETPPDRIRSLLVVLGYPRRSGTSASS